MKTYIDKALTEIDAYARQRDASRDDGPVIGIGQGYAAIAQAEAAERQAQAMEKIAAEMEHQRNLESSVHDCAVQLTRIAAVLEGLVSNGGNLKVELP